MNILDHLSKMKKMSTNHNKGPEYWGPCPGCGGDKRFHVWPELKNGEGEYWCRDCHKTGDLVQFFVDFRGMSYKAAFQAAGRETPAGYRPKSRYSAADYLPGQPEKRAEKLFQPTKYEEPCETWQKKAAALVEYSHIAMLENNEILAYLAARGLDSDAVRAFKLGWLPGEKGKTEMYRPRTAWGLPEIMKNNGRPKMLWLPRGIVIPYVGTNADGIEYIRRIRIRRPDEDLIRDRERYPDGKDLRYYVVPGSSMSPMLIYPDRQAYVIVETELDGMMLARLAGQICGVLATGSAQMKPDSESYPVLKKSVRVLNALDFDNAGKEASTWWGRELSQAKRWPVPAGKDPGDAYKAGVDIRAWILAGLPPVLKMKIENSQSAAPHKSVQVPETPVQTGPVELSQEERESVFEMPSNHQSSETQPGNITDLPAGVLELKYLLDRYPVKIEATATRMRYIQHPNFKNQIVMQRVSQLLFQDVSVWEFLERHPHDIIHRGNFFVGLSA